MGSASLEDTLLRTPFFGKAYAKRAAWLKKAVCVALARMGRLKPFSFVQWIATYGCNYSCPYCEASAGKPGDDELSTDEARGLIDDLAGMGVKRFIVSGGEPLTRRDCPGLLRHAQARGLSVGLVSNGSLLRSRWAELGGIKFYFYFTSIDGLPEYNDRVRGGTGAFRSALDSLEMMAGAGVPTRMLNTVVHPGNRDQLPELFEILRGSAATLWRLTPVTRVGRAADRGVESFGLGGTELRELLDFADSARGLFPVEIGESHSYLACFRGKPVGKPFFCGAGLTRASVLPDGTAIGCQVAYDPAFGEGNIRERPFSRLWQEEFRRFRTLRLREGCRQCDFRRSCGGGCWAEMELHSNCAKRMWFDGE
jgi:radical SAM protein with 4Fe4S-binding SPASM domain